MPDDLYHRDILAWSRPQAERLRRVTAGERVNGVDWEHVIEEIEDVGNGQLNAVKAYLELATLHALKARAWPEHAAAQHWIGEITNFLVQAQTRFEPGMQQHVAPVAIHIRAPKRFRRIPPVGNVPPPLPETVTLAAAELRDDEFGAADPPDRIRAAMPATPRIPGQGRST